MWWICKAMQTHHQCTTINAHNGVGHLCRRWTELHCHIPYVLPCLNSTTSSSLWPMLSHSGEHFGWILYFRKQRRGSSLETQIFFHTLFSFFHTFPDLENIQIKFHTFPCFHDSPAAMKTESQREKQRGRAWQAVVWTKVQVCVCVSQRREEGKAKRAD